MMKYKLLLVEDDPDLGQVVKQYLEMSQFQVDLCEDGLRAWEQFQKENYDLCIIDIMLPQLDGISLAKRIRQHAPSLPFIFVTAKDQKIDRLKGLQLGADDYITKPFDIDEVILRIHNILRRSGRTKQTTTPIGQFTFNATELTLEIADKTIRMTQQESKLLQFLVQHKNTLVKREEMLKAVWGDDDYFMGRSMDVFISRLRKYLKADPNVQIENVRGVGFLLKIERV